MTEARVAPINSALISVSDKTGVVPFAQALAAQGVKILSTGGTCRLLLSEGIPVTEVSDHYICSTRDVVGTTSRILFPVST